MQTAFISDPIFLSHDTGAGHPERSARLVAAHKTLSEQDWYGELQLLTPTPVERQWVELVHRPGYAQRIEEACAAGADWIDTQDVAVSPESCDVALNATGSLLRLVDQVMAKKADNGFAMVRPPGHHAEHDMAMGFCLFNSVAIAARYLQQHHGLERILILDWDVHHGNGTQHTFEADPSVMFISLHQFPHYPGTGAKGETGSGAGQGFTLNCPMSAGRGDDDYQEAFEQVILPKARGFKPDFILVSAGFDAHFADPLASMQVTTDGFRWMSKQMMALADELCGGRLVSVLEGGYDLDALADSVTAHVEVLLKG